VAPEVRRRRAVGAAPHAPARGVEPQAQADRCRPEPGQVDAAAHRRKKSLGPSRRRELVPELMRLFGCSQRNAMRVANVSQGSFFYKPVKRSEEHHV